MIIEQMVKQILSDGGMLDGWVDMFGDTQPAPKVQLMIFDELDILDNRCVFIRSSNGGGSKYVQKPIADIYIFGLEDKSDSITVADRGKDIFSYILTSPCYSDIMGTTQVNMSPVFLTDSGRPYINISFTAITDRGIS